MISSRLDMGPKNFDTQSIYPRQSVVKRVGVSGWEKRLCYGENDVEDLGTFLWEDEVSWNG
jgi:hypothetical protein